VLRLRRRERLAAVSGPLVSGVRLSGWVPSSPLALPFAVLAGLSGRLGRGPRVQLVAGLDVRRAAIVSANIPAMVPPRRRRPVAVAVPPAALLVGAPRLLLGLPLRLALGLFASAAMRSPMGVSNRSDLDAMVERLEVSKNTLGRRLREMKLA
jgi:hypothetical protein